MGKTRGQLVSKLQHMKSGMNNNLVRHIGYKDIDSICHYLLEDKHIIEELESSLDTQRIVIIAYEDDFKEYKWEIEQLEKALDKACEFIGCNFDCPYATLNQCTLDDRCSDDYKECWKEWLLDEVKE